MQSTSPAPKAIVDPATRREYPGVVATSIMLPKLTFAGLPKAAMLKAIGLAEQEFTQHASYAGVAIHDYEGFAAIAGRPPSLASRLWRQNLTNSSALAR